jgi:choline dehydrogenase
VIDLVDSDADPNDWRLVTQNAVGLRYTPLTTRNHARTGTRERVLETAQKYPDRLRLDGTSYFVTTQATDFAQ